MGIKFKTHYSGSTTKPEVNKGERLVETAGYIPAQQRIEGMMLAGKRLADARREMYDFPAGSDVDESLYDPTRSKNYDLADAFVQSETVKHRIKASQTAPKASGEAKKLEGEELPPPEGKNA